jgi:hypothetical protein
MMRFVAACAVVVVAVAGCTSSGRRSLLTGSGTPRTPYRGPLHVPIVAAGDNASVLDRSGAAGRALECRYPPYGGGQGVYHDGLIDVESTFVDAADEFIGPDNGGATLPSTGYRVERRVGDRVLLSFDVRGRTKVAIILRDGITDYRDAVGWGVETWAACDPAEYPADTVADLGIGVWHDADGRPVPIARVESFPGRAFCDYSDVDFVQIGNDRRAIDYVRDPQGQLTKYLRVPYDGDARLPADAINTGFHRGGRGLWFGPDTRAVYLVSDSGQRQVERWPAPKPGFGCG